MTDFRWTMERILRALGSNAVAGARGSSSTDAFSGVSTDTRALAPGNLFVALRGENFDGHDFVGRAAEAGAAGAIVTHIPEDAPESLRYFVVRNTLTALGELASFRRRSLRGRVVGVAGSNGKTTTKDLLRAALGARYRVHATTGNLNNQIGVPLTLLAAPDDAEVIVVEMGTNEPGEIAILTAIIRPDIAVVTCVAEEHLEKLGDLEGVLREETSIFQGLPAGGMAYVGAEPPSLPMRARELLGPDRVCVAGLDSDADLCPDGGSAGIELLPDGSTRWAWHKLPVHLRLPGRHNIRNALLALGVAEDLGVPVAEAVRAVEVMPAPKLRGEWLRIGGLRVLADCYNASPPSLAAAIDLLASLSANGRKVAVVGSMRELGSESEAIHRQAAQQIADRVGHGIDTVVATGDFVDAFAPLAPELEGRLFRISDPVDAFREIAGSLNGDETILLKASRSERLERWLPLLEGWTTNSSSDN